MRILSIETSCDETAVALTEFTPKENGATVKVLREMVHSQAETHATYGGVYPTVAKREHQNILPQITHHLLETTDSLTDDPIVQFREMPYCTREPAMQEHIRTLFSGKKVNKVDAIAVTNGPGLAPALWVGVNFTRTLATLWNLPIIPVNHMEGHIFAALYTPGTLTEPEYPLLSLLVSGGHTELILTPERGVYRKIGRTLDDAAGEAFDKAARMLGLPYPGGPEISKLAEKAKKKNLTAPTALPRPMLKDPSLNFSYSGLKTALRVFLEKHELTEEEKEGLAMEFEDAIVETLLAKTKKAVETYHPASLVLSGGVSANRHLRETFTAYSDRLHLSDSRYATDNAVMIALAAYMHRENTENPEDLTAQSNLSFPEE